MSRAEIISSGEVYRRPDSLFGYAAWPSVARLGDELLVVASGMRTAHIDPFGKVILMRSFDWGESFSDPSVILDTPLDDRDAGILCTGGKEVIVTSFNNTAAAQRSWLNRRLENNLYSPKERAIDGYIGRITPEAEKKFFGSVLIKSENNGYSFSAPVIIPITSPHGPTLTPSGRIIYVGKEHDRGERGGKGGIDVYEIKRDLSYKKIGEVTHDAELDGYLLCEPHAVALSENHFLVHIRIQQKGAFTVWQSESYDGGISWSEPRDLGVNGSPPHITVMSDGTLVSVYGKRSSPCGIRAMVSRDEGKTWETELPLVCDLPDSDIGYPASVELPDGSLFTVYYARKTPSEATSILYVKWRLV